MTIDVTLNHSELIFISYFKILLLGLPRSSEDLMNGILKKIILEKTPLLVYIIKLNWKIFFIKKKSNKPKVKKPAANRELFW